MLKFAKKITAWFTLCLMLSVHFSGTALATVTRGTQSNVMLGGTDAATTAQQIEDFAISETGVIHMVTHNYSNVLTYVKYDGTTWTTITLDSDTEDSASATIKIDPEDENNVSVMWREKKDSAGESYLYYRASTNGGSSFASTEDVDISGNLDNRSGRPGFIFTGDGDPTIRALMCSSTTVREYEKASGGSWSNTETLSTGGIDCKHISYIKDGSTEHAILAPTSGGGVDYIKQTGSTWSLEDNNIISGITSTSVGQSSELALDSDGNPRFAIADNEAGSGTDTIWFASHEGGSWTTDSVATGAKIGQHRIGLVNDPNGYDWVSYFDSNNGDIKVGYYDEDGDEWSFMDANSSGLTVDTASQEPEVLMQYNPLEQELTIVSNWQEVADTTSNIDKFTITTLPGWYQHSKEIASDGAELDQLGASVAIGVGSDSYNYAISGAIEAPLSPSGPGKAYIFKENTSGEFVEQDTLSVDGGGGDKDWFGYSSDIDGDYAVVGAYLADPDSKNAAGAAYVYKRTGTSWAQVDELIASDALAGDNFGYSVAISGDYIIVGAPADDNGNGTDAGSAYFFKRDNGADTWTEKDSPVIAASYGAGGNSFGSSVDIDGSNAVIGSPNSNSSTGGVYVYSTSDSGETWDEDAALQTNDAATGDNIGQSVAISGNYFITGATGDASDQGAAYVFFDNGGWAQQAKLVNSDGAANDEFGTAVDISGSGTIAIVSQLGDSGLAFLYDRDGTDWLTLRDEVYALTEVSGDKYGQSAAINTEYALVGAYLDDQIDTGSGAFYVLGLNDATLQASGGGGGVPEFKTYTLLLTLMIGFALIKDKYENEFGQSLKVSV